MRHWIAEALVRQFHTKTGTFHLSCGEYVVLPINWTTILGIRFGGHQIPTDEITFEMASDLLGIPFPLTVKTEGYLGSTASPQIRTEWLRHSIP